MAGRIAIGALVAALLCALAGTALGASRDIASDVSANWAGYAVTGADTSYTSVTGTWKQPRVTCGDGQTPASSSAFWVGLGGYSSTSKALEQIGTSADCDPQTGEPSYYAWYELVPDASVTIPKFTVRPGDLMTTSVNIVDGGSSVMLQVKNRTRQKTYTTTLPFANADLSSAEWVAEAPAGCNEYRCRQLSLVGLRLGAVHEDRRARELGRRHVDRESRVDGDRDLADPDRREAAIFPGPDRFSTARRLAGRCDIGSAQLRRSRIHGVMVGNPGNFLAAS